MVWPWLCVGEVEPVAGGVGGMQLVGVVWCQLATVGVMLVGVAVMICGRAMGVVEAVGVIDGVTTVGVCAGRAFRSF